MRTESCLGRRAIHVHLLDALINGLLTAPGLIPESSIALRSFLCHAAWSSGLPWFQPWPLQQIVHQGAEGILLPEVTSDSQVHNLPGSAGISELFPKPVTKNGTRIRLSSSRRGPIQMGKRPSPK